MSPRGIFTHVEIILRILDCLGQVYAGVRRYCFWVEFPVQRRLCPIFSKVASGNPTSTCIPRVDG